MISPEDLEKTYKVGIREDHPVIPSRKELSALALAAASQVSASLEQRSPGLALEFNQNAALTQIGQTNSLVP